MNKYYRWKILTEDGLLKDHPPAGPYYSSESLNDFFKSEEDAVKAYSDFESKYEHGVEDVMVLITVYSPWEL
jgi:hypothetical protein